MKLIMDACTAILLAKASVLETAMETYRIMMPAEAHEEVMAGKSKVSEDAFLLEKLAKGKKFEIVKHAHARLFQKLMADFGMGSGEAAAIACSMEHKTDAIATDNRMGRKVARIHNIPLVGSLSMITALYNQKKISREKALEAISNVSRAGWYSDHLIQQAKEDVSSG